MGHLLEQMDFGNEAGDDVDLDELIACFVEQRMFKHFLKDKKILIATAKKGVGKSALIQWLSHMIPLQDHGAMIIKCRGADLVRSKFNLTSELRTPNDYIQDWMIRICALVNRQIARDLGIALTDDQITLVESAELDGYRSRNLVSCLTDRFLKILGKAQPTKLTSANDVELLKRSKKHKLWILIDDLDATFQKTAPESLELSTFFSACRYLTQDMKDILFRVTLRTDVWSIIRRYDESLDKVEQYINNIVWRRTDFRKLLYKRIKAQCEILNIHEPEPPIKVKQEEIEEHLLKKVFVPKMPWGDSPSYTYRVIYTLSYQRPRWAIQLCKLAQNCALDLGDDLIDRRHIDAVWGEYGKKRIADLVAEHKHQCRQVEELVTAFRGSERRLSRDQLMGWINNRILTHMRPIIENETVNSPMEVAQFLYRIGFIVARSDNKDDSYEHYSFSQMPDFLSSRTNDDFGVAWEIHPCYREALDIVKLNRSRRRERTL